MNSSTFINSRIGDCRIIELERIAHDNGTIAVAQNSDRLPFAMKRAFYLYDIPPDHRAADTLTLRTNNS